MSHVLRFVPLLGALLGSPVFGDEPPPAVPPTAPTTESTATPKKLHASTYAIGGGALSDPAGFPVGFGSADLQPPVIAGVEGAYDLGIDTGNHARPPMGLWGDFHIGSPRSALDFLAGIAGGVDVQLEHAVLRFGLLIEDQALLSRGPFGGSHLDTWRWSPLLRGTYDGGWWKPFAEVKWWNVYTAGIASYEGIPTQIAWDTTTSLRVGSRLDLPFLPLSFEGALGYFGLGAAAIASKEFGLYIGRQNVVRPEIAAGVTGEHLELWLRYLRAIPVRDDDPIEYLYQAPFLFNDNLMIRNALLAEVRYRW